MRISSLIEALEGATSRSRCLAVAAAFTFAASLSGSAEADSTLIVDSYTLGQRVSILYDGRSERVWTAEFDDRLIDETGKIRDGKSYCIDLDQYLGVETVTPVTLLAPSSSPQLLAASYLLDNWHGLTGLGVTQEVAITGLQLAIWETYYDHGSIDLNSGSFQVVDASLGAHTAAQTILASLPASLSESDLSGYLRGVMSETRQDQLFRASAPIPEPGSALLFLLGGAVTARAIRRRS